MDITAIALRKVIGRTGDLQRFFGVSLTAVNPLILQIAINAPGSVPEWLRGVSRLSMLPRFVSAGSLLSEASAAGLSDRSIAERIQWIVEDGSGSWSMDENCFRFESDGALMHYRLAFN